MKKLRTGTAIIEVTPTKPVFLHGYPYVERISEGVNDSLYASALIFDNGESQVCICMADVIFISKEITRNVRDQVKQITNAPDIDLMISVSHTHSGPVIVSDHFYDPVVPKADPEFIADLTEKLIKVCVEAFYNIRDCSVGLAIANGDGIGGNRRSKNDTTDPEVPVLIVKDAQSKKLMAVMVVYCMHPTVLHEDSRLISADFPGYTRTYIGSKLGKDVVLLYGMGPSGNQSPRHFIKSNTLDEAMRLGEQLGKRIVEAIDKLEQNSFYETGELVVRKSMIELPRKEFMDLREADEKLEKVRNKLTEMREKQAPATEIRTVECDLFGAEENLQIAEMAKSGALDKVYESVLPAEISVLTIRDYHFVFLPGELFVEYSLEIKARSPKNTFVISLSNGLLGGYIVTEEAEKEGGYEASNGIFSSASGKLIVNEAVRLVLYDYRLPTNN